MTNSKTMEGDHEILACTACPARALAGFNHVSVGEKHGQCANREKPGAWAKES